MKKNIKDVVMFAEEILGVSLTDSQVELIEALDDHRGKNLPIIGARRKPTPNTIPSIVEQYYQMRKTKTTYDLQLGRCYEINGRKPIVITEINTNLKTGKVKITGYSPRRYKKYLELKAYEASDHRLIAEMDASIVRPLRTHFTVEIECNIKEITDVKF